jgi:Lrp/AsnC family transcriptional regulator, leucine-responsive regulatory protein
VDPARQRYDRPYQPEGIEARLPLERRSNSRIADDALDPVNRRLLAELQDDGRLSTAELARRVNLSPPAVAERVRRLEQAGVITGYRAVIDPRAVGYPLAAVVRIRPAPRQLPKVAEIAAQVPEVVECHRITGDDCFLLTVRLHSMDDLEPILDRFVLYGQTTTSIVQSSPVPARGVPLGEVGDGRA